MRRLIICLLLAGCTTIAPLPTVSSIEMAQTAEFLTQNAPPPGFQGSISYPRIDDKLSDLPGWHYHMLLAFDGYFAGTQNPAKGQIEADVFGHEPVGERRVVLKASGAAFGLSQDRNAEGVRIINDYYLVDSNQVCTKIAEPGKAPQVADLAAGSLIGGIKKAVPMSVRRKENDVDIWEYTFSPNDVVPPVLQAGSNGSLTVVAGDLWIAPTYKAVWRYTVTFNVENIMLRGDQALTGQVRASYQLIEAGQDHDIPIPFGC